MFSVHFNRNSRFRLENGSIVRLFRLFAPSGDLFSSAWSRAVCHPLPHARKRSVFRPLLATLLLAHLWAAPILSYNISLTGKTFGWLPRVNLKSAKYASYVAITVGSELKGGHLMKHANITDIPTYLRKAGFDLGMSVLG